MPEMMICPKGCKNCAEQCEMNHSLPHVKHWTCDEIRGTFNECVVVCIPYVEPVKGPNNLASNSEIEKPNQAQNNTVTGPTEQVSRTDVFLAEYEKEQASSLSEEPLLTKDEINALLNICDDTCPFLLDLRNVTCESEMDIICHKCEQFQIAKAQHAKTARLIFAELDKGCKHSFITRNCPECYQEVKKKYLLLFKLRWWYNLPIRLLYRGIKIYEEIKTKQRTNWVDIFRYYYSFPARNSLCPKYRTGFFVYKLHSSITAGEC